MKARAVALIGAARQLVLLLSDDPAKGVVVDFATVGAIEASRLGGFRFDEEILFPHGLRIMQQAGPSKERGGHRAERRHAALDKAGRPCSEAFSPPFPLRGCFDDTLFAAVINT